MCKKNYTLNFFEAIEKTLNKEGYIRGEHFKAGTFVANHNGVLVLKEKKLNGYYQIIGNLPITVGLKNQKFKENR